MDLFLQRIVDGLTNGALYAALALALVIIYKGTGLINFAQGEMAMFGIFIALVLAAEQGLPVWLAILISMAIMAAAATVLERVLVRPLEHRSHLAVVIVTLGLFLIINGVAGEIWGFDPRAFASPFPTEPDDNFDIAGARVQYQAIGIYIVLLAVLGVFFLLLKKTKIGLSFRAVSSNRESSELVGVRVGRTLQIGWALAAAMGALGGALVANTLLVEPNMMFRLLIFAFAAAALGGLDSLGGAVIGGILVGLIQSMVGGYVTIVGSELSLATALAVIMVVLLFRPNGMFGTRTVERV